MNTHQPTASLTNGGRQEAVVITEEPIEELQVAYRSPTGKMVYRTFRIVDTIGGARPIGNAMDSGIAKVHSESEEQITCSSQDPTEVLSVPISSTHDCRDPEQNSLEDKVDSSDALGAHHQDNTSVGQFSSRVGPVADDQASLYSFL